MVARSDAGRDLLAAVNLPPASMVSERAPSKALESLPETPSIPKQTVSSRFWTVPQSADEVLAWLRQHPPQNTTTMGSGHLGSPGSSIRYLSYHSGTRPIVSSLQAAYLYLSVVATGPNTSAVAAYAVTPDVATRAPVETVPTQVDRVVVRWSLAPGGTPVLKTLHGQAAATMAREFNRLPVDNRGPVACPMIPSRFGDITVTFVDGGHRWVATIPACPNIGVTYDGRRLPPLAFGKAFLDDLKSYTGDLPHVGPPGAGPIPLLTPPPR